MFPEALLRPTAEQVLLVAVPAIAVALWFVALRIALHLTRPRPGRALPATQDLGGDEPPAVVSFLVNRWRVTEDAVEATLVDLAARDHLEFRQLSDDPMATTVHLVDAPGRPHEHLTDYEESVLGRVAAVAVGGVAPVTALTFRDAAKAGAWWGGFRSAVVADARARGLSRRRMPPRLVTALSAAALVPAAAVAWAAGRIAAGDGWEVAAVSALFTATALGGIAGRPRGERDTPAGRQAAARWLGLRRYLAVDEAFQELPPAAVTVWDRYLAYGDALGMARVCAAVLDLGLGDRRHVWSSFGGSWHRVRVRYPAATSTFGARVLGVAAAAVATGAVGWLLTRVPGYADEVLTAEELSPSTRGTVDLVVRVLLVVGVLLLARAAYRLVRALVDGLTPLQVRGEVLWTGPARTVRRDDADVVLNHYLAVDDGTTTTRGHRTVAWALPAELAGLCTPGDLVDLTVRRWTRRVLAVAVVEHRSVDAVQRRAPRSAPPAAPGAAPPSAPASPVRLQDLLAGAVPALVPAGPALALAGDLPAGVLEEVAAAVGADPGEVQVRPAFTGATTGVTFEVVRAGADPVPALTMVVSTGQEGALLLAAHRRRGTPLPGVGDEAWTGPGWSLARSGDVTVRVGRSAQGRADDAALPLVLRAALATAGGRLRTSGAPAAPPPGP